MQRVMNASGDGDLESQDFVAGSDHSTTDNGNASFHLAPAEFVHGYESGTSRSITWQVKMYEAASKGDWKEAENVLKKDPDVFRERITERGDRALHIAAATKQTKFVRELVREMDAEDLLSENDYGHTAFIYAAASGIVEIAAVMREKNESLVTIRGHEDKKTPIYVADVALKILGDHKSLACMTREKESPLRVLAQHDISDISSSKEIFLESLVSVFAAVPILSWLKKTCKQPLMRKKARLLAQTIWKEIQGMEDPRLFHKLFNDSPVLHEAAKIGNVGFINMLTHRYPDLMFKLDSNRHTIFHIAVLYRQEKELPTELFSHNHDKLLKQGEKEMKETAGSCMLAATLTAPVVFAAAFTVPGGTNETTGTPILLERPWFRVFMATNAAAMFFSTFSITMFLAILTSRFQEDDFLVSLPRKLILGLTALFATIDSTLFAFTSTCILLIDKDKAWAPKLFSSIACFSLTILFIRMHIKLWIDTFRSTYLSRALRSTVVRKGFGETLTPDFLQAENLRTFCGD